jgi:hypothetical protein
MVRNDDFFSIFKVLFHAYIKNFKFSREINMAILIFKNKNKILEFFFFCILILFKSIFYFSMLAVVLPPTLLGVNFI